MNRPWWLHWHVLAELALFAAVVAAILWLFKMTGGAR